MSGFAIKTNAALQTSAYIKGDSLIVMAINASKNSHDMKLKLPYKVSSGIHLLSTGNETEKLCQTSSITIEEPVNELTVSYPSYSLNTYIFMIDNGSTAIQEIGDRRHETGDRRLYYDLHGRRLSSPSGLCIERSSDGSARKVIIR